MSTLFLAILTGASIAFGFYYGIIEGEYARGTYHVAWAVLLLVADMWQPNRGRA